MCDKNRWCSPRIRYASIRSKPELCKDLLNFFGFEREEDQVRIIPIRPIHGFPILAYDLKARCFSVDGVLADFPRLSRARPEFRLEHTPVTLEFGTLYAARGSDIVFAASPMFP